MDRNGQFTPMLRDPRARGISVAHPPAISSRHFSPQGTTFGSGKYAREKPMIFGVYDWGARYPHALDLQRVQTHPPVWDPR